MVQHRDLEITNVFYTSPSATSLFHLHSIFTVYGQLNVCVPPDSYVEALTPSRGVFGDGASKEVIEVKRGHKCETLVQYGWFLKRRRDAQHSPFAM